MTPMVAMTVVAMPTMPGWATAMLIGLSTLGLLIAMRERYEWMRTEGAAKKVVVGAVVVFVMALLSPVGAAVMHTVTTPRTGDRAPLFRLGMSPRRHLLASPTADADGEEVVHVRDHPGSQVGAHVYSKVGAHVYHACLTRGAGADGHAAGTD
jgi:hypothetical protein